MMMMMNSLARRRHDGDGLLLLSVVASSHPFASFIRLCFGMNVTFTFLAKKQIKMTKGYYGVVGLWSFQTCLVVGTICSAEGNTHDVYDDEWRDERAIKWKLTV